MARVSNVVPKERAFHPLVRAVRRVATTGTSCPTCGSIEVRRSDRWTFRDFLFAGFFLAPFRCRFCRTRFYWFWRPTLKEPADSPFDPLLRMPRQIFEIYPLKPHPTTADSAAPVSAEPDSAAPDSAESQLTPPERPLAPFLEPPPSAAQPVRVPSPRSVLILESDPSIRRLLCRLLDRRGYFTHEVIQPDDLAADLRDRRVDLLIIADELNSVLAAAHVYPNLKILALSSEPLDGVEIPGRCLALAKPFASHMFLECVDRLLEVGQTFPSAPAAHLRSG
jgi:hypothetical protein